MRISGTKIDSLGQTNFPGGADSVDVGFRDVITLLEKNGYYTTEQGQNYFFLDLFSSDRLTGDIYSETHPVLLDPNVPLGSPWFAYKNAKFNGILNLDDPNAPALDEAKLWAVLSDLSPDAGSDNPVSVHGAVKNALSLEEADLWAALTDGQGTYSDIPDEEENSADFDLVA